MEDTGPCFDVDDFPWFQGVDLTLWLQLVVLALLVGGGGSLAWALAG